MLDETLFQIKDSEKVGELPAAAEGLSTGDVDLSRKI